MAISDDIPKQMTAARKTSVQAMNLLAGEMVGTAVEIGVLANIDKLDKAAPEVTGGIKHVIKNVLIRPLLRPIEWCMNYTRGIEGEQQFKRRMGRSEDERAERMANATYRYTGAIGACYGAMSLVQHELNRITGAPMKKKTLAILLGADAAIHLGSIVVMGSPSMSSQTQNVKGAMACVFKSFGLNEEKADDMANYGIAVQLPNYMTYAADVGLLYALNKKFGGIAH